MQKLEFFISPNGRIYVTEDGDGIREFTEKEITLGEKVLELIERQYPETKKTLDELYNRYSKNIPHYIFVRASRFIRCNFGKFDGLSFDVDENVLHVEEVSCPIRSECPFCGTICKPKPFGLTQKEFEVTKRMANGMTYKEISSELNIAHSTIKNIIQKVKEKLNLKSSKDVAKLMVAVSVV